VLDELAVLVAGMRFGERVAIADPQDAPRTISLRKPRESTAISEDLGGGELEPEPTDLNALSTRAADSPVIWVGGDGGSDPPAPVSRARLGLPFHAKSSRGATTMGRAPGWELRAGNVR